MMEKRSWLNKTTNILIAIGCLFTIVGIPLAVLILQNEEMLNMKEQELTEQGLIKA